MKILPLIAAVSTLAITATANESVTLRYVAFIPAGDGESVNPDADGMAMVRYNASSGWTRIQVMMRGLEPNETYGVQFAEDFGSVNGLTTNSQGRGNFVGEFVTPPTLDGVVQIFQPDDEWIEPRKLCKSELRAISLAPL